MVIQNPFERCPVLEGIKTTYLPPYIHSVLRLNVALF